MDVYGPETGDLIAAYRLQKETLLYPMDCVLLATTQELGGTFVTFDSEPSHLRWFWTDVGHVLLRI